MSPERIERVGQPKEERAGAAGDEEPEERAEDRVVAVFKRRFDGGLGHAGCIEMRGLARHDHRHCRARGGKIAGGKGRGDGQRMLGEASSAEGEGEQREIEERMGSPGRQQNRRRDEEQPGEKPPQPVADRMAGRAPSQQPFGRLGQPPEAGERMEALGLAEQPVDEHGGKSKQGRREKIRHMKALMIQGCTSDAGKSVLVAALCRILARKGVKVAPFKPQNMALNSAVTVDGGEIGRAQALQAQAAGLIPRIDFNPVLLKPSADKRAQVIIHGQPIGELSARDYHDYKRVAREAVLASWKRLTAEFDCVIVEGAGSPAEVNLRANDIANMGFAEAVDIPVWLVGDIDRGGVLAHFIGTLACLSDSERARITAFVINKFRGDLGLLQPGIDWLSQKTGKPVAGVVPYLSGLFLDAEDALAWDVLQTGETRLTVAAPVYPRIANATDLDPLRLHPEVDFRWVGPGQALPPCDLIVLPGSKAVAADLAWLRAQGHEEAIKRHLRYGGKVIGLCGGYQMLGRALHDPLGLEGAPGSMAGLGLLDCETTLEPKKQLRQVSGILELGAHGTAQLRGYEIHMGVTKGPALARHALRLDDGRVEGARSEDGQILGTYCHGLFDEPAALAALLFWAGAPDVAPFDLAARREADLERLADAVEGSLDPMQLQTLF